MNIKDRRLLAKPEATFGDPNTDFATGGQFLTVTGSGDTLRTAKTLAELGSNTAGAISYQQTVGRTANGQIPTQLDRDSRRLVFDLGFGGFEGANGGAPTRELSHGLIKQKGDVSGEQYRGLTVQSMNIAAAAGGFVIPTLDCVCQGSTKIAAPTIDLPATRRRPYKFAMGVTAINGAISANINNMALQVNNNLNVGPARESCLEPAYIERGELSMSGSSTVRYTSEIYNDLVRGTDTGEFAYLFGEAYATHDGTGWNCADFFEDGQPCLLFSNGVFSAVTASVAAGVLNNAGSAGDVIAQNAVLVKVNAAEFPECPETSGQGGIVDQAINWQLTAGADTTINPVEVWFDGVQN